MWVCAYYYYFLMTRVCDSKQFGNHGCRLSSTWWFWLSLHSQTRAGRPSGAPLGSSALSVARTFSLMVSSAMIQSHLYSIVHKFFIISVPLMTLFLIFKGLPWIYSFCQMSRHFCVILQGETTMHMQRPPSQIESQKVAIELGEQEIPHWMSPLQTILSFYFLLVFIKTKVETNKNSLTQESEDGACKLRFCNVVEDLLGLMGFGRLSKGKVGLGGGASCSCHRVVLFKGKLGRTIYFHLEKSPHQCGATIRIRIKHLPPKPVATTMRPLLEPFPA